MGHHESCPKCGNKNASKNYCPQCHVANTPYTPAEQKEYERFAAMCAQQAMRGREKFIGPTRVECKFWFGIPKSRVRKLRDGDWHTQKPDTDNLVKSIWDSVCCGICTADDCTVVQMVAEKRWTTGIPRTEVSIYELASRMQLELEAKPAQIRPQQGVLTL